MYDINITIVNYKEKDKIARCLAGLFVDLRDSELEAAVIIVDNASGDGIEEMLKQKYPDVKFISLDKNSGFGKAQNIGLSSIRAKYYLALNPDTVFPEGGRFFRKMHDFMEANKKVGIAGPKIIYPDGSLQYSCFRFPKFLQPLYSRTRLGTFGKGKKEADKFFMRNFERDETLPVDWVMGAAMFVRDEAIQQVGFFDERFWMYAEDSDWCRRMWENGWLVYYVHDVCLEHAHGKGSAKVKGIIKPLIKNRLAREHLISWLKYMWKWRKNHKHYVE